MVFNFYSWCLDCQLILVGAPFVMCLIGVVIQYYIACSRHFRVMLAAMQNSTWPSVQCYKYGVVVLTSRLNLVAGISGFLTWKSYSIRKGLVNFDDVRNFPSYLQHWLVASFWLVMVGITWLALAVGLVELSER